MRLQAQKPDVRLVFTGVHAAGGRELIQALWGSRSNMDSVQILPGGRDTRAEALDICHSLGNRPFVLVTSASHMPRAMEWLRRIGCVPVPAPTDQRSIGSASLAYLLLPRASGLQMSDDALHEYIGWIALICGFS
jgi:hypothetical protein